jgi:hypothetical protein
MDIFSIPHPPYRELATMEGDLDKLEAIWSVVAEWERSYMVWKNGKFKDINVRVRSWLAGPGWLNSAVATLLLAAH